MLELLPQGETYSVRIASMFYPRFMGICSSMRSDIKPRSNSVINMKSSILWKASLLTTTALGATPFNGELNGLPINPYDPYCAMACYRSLYTLMLSCSSTGETVGMMTMSTTSECWATNVPFLTSLAWCMHTKCVADDIKRSKLEYFWETQATGQE